jgi:hypothetical protein
MESTGTTQPTNLINHIVVRVSGKDRGLHPSPPFWGVGSGILAFATNLVPRTTRSTQKDRRRRGAVWQVVRPARTSKNEMSIVLSNFTSKQGSGSHRVVQVAISEGLLLYGR